MHTSEGNIPNSSRKYNKTRSFHVRVLYPWLGSNSYVKPFNSSTHNIEFPNDVRQTPFRVIEFDDPVGAEPLNPNKRIRNKCDIKCTLLPPSRKLLCMTRRATTQAKGGKAYRIEKNKNSRISIDACANGPNREVTMLPKPRSTGSVVAGNCVCMTSNVNISNTNPISICIVRSPFIRQCGMKLNRSVV